jgi:hypothetical protein
VSMKAKKNKREPSRADASPVSAGLRDVLGMTQWRKEHPHATWAEIEAAVDEQINQLRAQLLQDLVQLGEGEDWRKLPQEERPRCAILSPAVVGTWGADTLPPNDRRRSGQVEAHLWHLPDLWGRLFSRLHEQLGLLAGGLTPRAEETLVRLACWMSFEAAQELLQDLLGVPVSKATAHRATLASGEAALAVCEREEERLQLEAPQAPRGAEKQAMSGDGAFVLLVESEWVEGKHAHDRRGQAERARGGMSGADLLLLAAGGRPAFCAGRGGGNTPAGCGAGNSGVCCARWSTMAARAGGLPPSGCGAHLGFCPCRRIHQ